MQIIFRLFRDSIHALGRPAEPALCRAAEQTLRLHRAKDEITGPIDAPTTDEVMEFYRGFEKQVACVERAVAAHIIVHVNEARDEARARASIEDAQSELEKGVSFAEVADRSPTVKEMAACSMSSSAA